MSENNEQYAYFTIVGSFDPLDITKQVGVEPTDAWCKGDPRLKNRTEYKFSRWSLYSRLEKSNELEEHIRDVLKQIDKSPKAFQDVSQRFSGRMQLVGYWNIQYPGLHFELDIVEGLAKYSLSIDFDFYCSHSDGCEDKRGV